MNAGVSGNPCARARHVRPLIVVRCPVLWSAWEPMAGAVRPEPGSPRVVWRQRPETPYHLREKSVDTSVLGIYTAQLEALARLLRGQGLTVEAVMGGLVVREGEASVVVTCRPRHVDNNDLWFFAEVDEPLVEADDARMMDAVVAIKGKLAAS